MTITSIGYDGSVDEQQWARLSGYLGKPPCVADSAAWKVTTVVGPDRTVRVAAGSGYGHGIQDTSDATVDVQLAAIGAGTRWDTIVGRRDWTPPSGTTAFTAVTGTATQAVAAGLLADPGVSADQALALVQLTAGQSTPTAVVDLRALPTHTVTYPSVLALPASAPVGTVADVAGSLYVKGGGGWVAPTYTARAVGSTNITPSGANVATSQYVAFPAGRFTAPPKVLAVLGTGVTGSITAFVWAGTITKDGFTAWLNRSSSTTSSITWLAEQL